MTRVVYGPEIFRQHHGGISRYVTELHRHMPRYGVASHVFAGMHANRLLPDDGTVTGRRLPSWVTKGYDPLSALNDASAALWLRRHGKGAVFHKSYYTGWAQLAARGPVVVTVHDLIHALFPQFFSPDDPTVAQQRASCARADLVLAVSENTASDLERLLGVPRERVVVTPLGVSPPAPEEGVGGDRAPKPYLLYVGSRSGYKNWESVVRAYAAAPGLAKDFALVCAGGGGLRASEAALLAALGVAGRVRQRSASDLELGRLYAGAAAYVYPSLYEGFGLPPLEAMVRGCPVVASRAGSVPEVLGDAAALVDPCSVEELADALRTVAYDSDVRARLVAAGRVRAERFTWDRTAALTAAAYRSLG